MDWKKYFNFAYPFFDLISKGSLIVGLFNIVLRIIGVGIIFYGVFAFFHNISRLPDFWSFILTLLLLSVSIISSQVFFYRASQTSNIEETDFFVIPLFANFIKAIGEFSFLNILFLGIGGFIMLAFSNYPQFLSEFSPFFLKPFIYNTFIGGISFLLNSWIFAFIILLFFYFIAELISLLSEIAINTRYLKRNSVNDERAENDVKSKDYIE